MMVSRKVFCGATWPLRTGMFASVAPGLGETLQDFDWCHTEASLPFLAAERTMVKAHSAWRLRTD